MPGPVVDVADQRRIGAEVVDDQPGELDVLVLLVRGDVVHLAGLALAQHELDAAAVIVDVEPVADLLAVAVERQRLAVERVGREERQDLLRILVGPVCVGAARDRSIHPERTHRGEHLEVAACLRRAVWARRPQRIILA